MCRWIFLLLLLWAAQPGRASERLIEQSISSHFLKTNRVIRVYLPISYEHSTGRHYPVLYLHDGQNLFSDAGTNICFGWGNWELDKTVDELSRTKQMEEAILVSVDNSPNRYSEYCGRHHSTDNDANTAFENYASFLIRELKPRIDAEYRTRPESRSTGVMGSSMGGICSVILAWEHPEVFGRAASLSGSFQVEATNFLKNVLRPYQSNAKPVRFYLDSGVVDFAGGDDGRSLTSAVCDELRRIGWRNDLFHFVDEKPLTVAELEKVGLRRDKWAEAQTSQHNEFYWRLRARKCLSFLFPPMPRNTD